MDFPSSAYGCLVEEVAQAVFRRNDKINVPLQYEFVRPNWQGQIQTAYGHSGQNQLKQSGDMSYTTDLYDEVRFNPIPGQPFEYVVNTKGLQIRAWDTSSDEREGLVIDDRHICTEGLLRDNSISIWDNAREEWHHPWFTSVSNSHNPCIQCNTECNKCTSCNSCYDQVLRCSLCTTGCTVGCTTGCTQACTSGCTHGCTSGCTLSCTTGCTAALTDGSCGRACTTECNGGCTTGCNAGCTTDCDGCTDCTMCNGDVGIERCTGVTTCSAACTAGCTTGCTKACTAACTTQCDSSCTTECQNYLNGLATKDNKNKTGGGFGFKCNQGDECSIKVTCLLFTIGSHVCEGINTCSNNNLAIACNDLGVSCLNNTGGWCYDFTASSTTCSGNCNTQLFSDSCNSAAVTTVNNNCKTSMFLHYKYPYQNDPTVQTCGTSCDGGCQVACTGCDGGCTTGDQGCPTCHGYCAQSCTSSCTNTCAGGCTGQCTSSCTSNCTANCTSSCTTGCTATCAAGCQEGCTKCDDCTTSCTGTRCAGFCHNYTCDPKV